MALLDGTIKRFFTPFTSTSSLTSFVFLTGPFPLSTLLCQITEEFRHDCQVAWDHFGSEGRRVFAFAYKQFQAPASTKFVANAEEPAYPQQGLIFLGMAAMMDPPRQV